VKTPLGSSTVQTFTYVAPVSPPAPPDPASVSTVYRFWSPTNKSHFYTNSVAERDLILRTYPSSMWTYEGGVYNAFSSQQPGTVPLYRFWSANFKGHFYTTSEAEKNQVIATYDKATWLYEGIAFYVYPVDPAYAGTVTVARFWSQDNKHHFYTASAAERDYVIATYPTHEWAFEQDAFRVPSTPVVDAPGGTAPGGTASPPPVTPAGSPPARWVPPAHVTWQWQLSGALDLSVNAQVYDVDLFDTSAQQVQQLHSQGRKVICYLSAGSYEPGRPDSATFPAAVLGNGLSGWPGERWFDIRQLNVLMPLIAARLDLCAAKGFDGVEPDNVDGYQNNSGFNLTANDQLTFNRALAQLAHDRGLAVGLKNDLDQVAALQPAFDFAVNEQCAEYNECSLLSPFITAGKPVLHVEYNLPVSSFCPTTTAMGFSSMLKTLDLDATRTPCP